MIPLYKRWGVPPPRMIYRDNGLPTFVHVHLMHDNPLLAAAPKLPLAPYMSVRASRRAHRIPEAAA